MVSVGRGYVYDIQYVIVWCTKDSKEVLVNEVSEKLREILRKLALDNGFLIDQIEIEPSFVKVITTCKPQHIIPDMLKALKGSSARYLVKEIPELKEKMGVDHLWNPSYFISTKLESSETEIQEYIQKQKK